MNIEEIKGRGVKKALEAEMFRKANSIKEKMGNIEDKMKCLIDNKERKSIVYIDIECILKQSEELLTDYRELFNELKLIDFPQN